MLIRHEIGDVLREIRLSQNQTLRQIAARASVALGYLSEIERGQKEASSEILGSLALALGTPVSTILRKVSDRMALLEGVVIPDSIPESFAAQVSATNPVTQVEFDEFDRFLLGTANSAEGLQPSDFHGDDVEAARG